MHYKDCLNPFVLTVVSILFIAFCYNHLVYSPESFPSLLSVRQDLGNKAKVYTVIIQVFLIWRFEMTEVVVHVL